jgi:hypothetical protein
LNYLEEQNNSNKAVIGTLEIFSYPRRVLSDTNALPRSSLRNSLVNIGVVEISWNIPLHLKCIRAILVVPIKQRVGHNDPRLCVLHKSFYLTYNGYSRNPQIGLVGRDWTLIDVSEMTESLGRS